MIGQQTLPPWVTDPTEHPRWDGERIVPYSESVRESAPAVVGDGSPTGAKPCPSNVPYDRHEWIDGVKRRDCPGVRERVASSSGTGHDAAAQLQKLTDAAATCAREIRAAFPLTRWQRICCWFSYHCEIIAMHLRGDFRAR